MNEEKFKKIDTRGIDVLISCGNCSKEMNINDENCSNCKESAPLKIEVNEPTTISKLSSFLIKAPLWILGLNILYSLFRSPGAYDELIDVARLVLGVLIGFSLLVGFFMKLVGIGLAKSFAVSRDEYVRRYLEANEKKSAETEAA